ncbi:hypothetical protein Ae201684P_008757 [Aphanomyces euteiches]|uniref:Uncharacterized protein n=1 Tax=Aphanomyces euteiches TaxID=100861 RepID=A0A6G0XF75_9STRA|nr:hypothetical protein Ae201684_005407 [Aphanomyces euteiches]KAH9093093.1 hypothetical protein Ae201684P_008757 [Aphanomyces euteiches]
MLTRMSRRILTRIERPVLVTTNVDFGEENHERLPTFPRIALPVVESSNVFKAASYSFKDPFVKLNLIRKQLENGFRELKVQSVDVPVASPEPSSPSTVHFDLSSLLSEVDTLPSNELRQVYEFDRTSHGNIPIERYFTLGQHLYQSMMWTTHPSAWHSVGKVAAFTEMYIFVYQFD